MHHIHNEIGTPKIIKDDQGNNRTIFTIKPLPDGYGITLGNSHRRVLLSSLPGCAVTGIKIDNVLHEYSAIAGVKDNVLDIMLNLKQLQIEKVDKEKSILTLDVKKEGVITAKDIKTPSNVKILNPDLYITTLNDSKKAFKMQIRVEKGVGYKSIYDLRKEEDDETMLLIDATFTPVLNVQYSVNSTRVGQKTNLDELVLDITTDGTLTPENALKFSANILQSYYSLFNEDKIIVEKDFIASLDDVLEIEKEERKQEEDREDYTPIEILNLSPRTLNSLINGGIVSVEQLMQCTESKLVNLRGFGKKAMTEVKSALKSRDLKLIDQD